MPPWICSAPSVAQTAASNAAAAARSTELLRAPRRRPPPRPAPGCARLPAPPACRRSGARSPGSCRSGDRTARARMPIRRPSPGPASRPRSNRPPPPAARGGGLVAARRRRSAPSASTSPVAPVSVSAPTVALRSSGCWAVTSTPLVAAIHGDQHLALRPARASTNKHLGGRCTGDDRHRAGEPRAVPLGQLDPGGSQPCVVQRHRESRRGACGDALATALAPTATATSSAVTVGTQRHRGERLGRLLDRGVEQSSARAGAAERLRRRPGRAIRTRRAPTTPRHRWRRAGASDRANRPRPPWRPMFLPARRAARARPPRRRRAGAPGATAAAR